MERLCTSCKEHFLLDEQEMSIVGRLAPKIGEKRYYFPIPTLCPNCRERRRTSFRNSKHYYRNICFVCKKPTISIYSPDKPIKVVCEDCYWGEKFDPLAFGKEYDFSRSFFQQFAEMRSEVPRLAFYNTQSENSIYTVHSSRNKDCYLSSSLLDSEGVLYSDFLVNCRDCLDLYSSSFCELCYEAVFSTGCFSSSYIECCQSVSECYLCFDCRGSSYLVGCVSRRSARNQILNRQATREEVMQTIARLNSEPEFRSKFLVQYEALKLSLPKREAWVTNCEESTGDYLWNCKNVHSSYNLNNVEDGCYAYESSRVKDCADVTRIAGGEAIYECVSGVDIKYSAFCNLCYQCDSLLYCDNCQGGSRDLLGCVSLQKKQFCILNRQYSKSDYQNLAARIIEQMKVSGEWGEFFPAALSPFGYNETEAFERSPRTEDQIKTEGLLWSSYEQPVPEDLKAVLAENLPSSIQETDDNILEQAVICRESGRPFKIVSKELEFYRRQGLPLPQLSPYMRHRSRISRMTPRTIWNRCCEKCGKEIRSCYSLDRPEIVYCNKCYESGVY